MNPHTHPEGATLEELMDRDEAGTISREDLEKLREDFARLGPMFRPPKRVPSDLDVDR